MQSAEDVEKMATALAKVAEQIRGRAGYFTMALGLLMWLTVLGMISAIMSEAWTPGLGLGLGLILAVLVTTSILMLGGLLVETWIYAMESGYATKSDELYTEREASKNEVDKLRYEVEKIRAESPRAGATPGGRGPGA